MFVFIWAISSFVLTIPSVAFEETLFATKGQHFYTTLKKDTFFKGINDIEFSVSLDEMPDLPGWLKFEQNDAAADGVLYGTPDNDAHTVSLAVIGWNKETYDTLRKEIVLSVSEKAGNITHKIEMKVKNKGVTDLIRNGNEFLKIVNNIWGGARHLVFVRSSSHRGIRTHKGAYVGIAGNTQYPTELKSLQEKCDGISLGAADSKIKRNFEDSIYDIDWCAFKDLKPNGVAYTEKYGFDDTSKYFDAVLDTTKWDDETSDLTLDIVYVFIAVFIGLLLIVFVTSVMFLNREGLQQRNNLTPKQQLLHHKSLRRAGAQIRNMSGKDEESNGFPYGKLDEDSKFESGPPPQRQGAVKKQDSKF